MSDMDEIIINQVRKALREWANIKAIEIREVISPEPCKLAVIAVCDRSKPPFLFAIYDEHGEVVIDDC